MDSSTITATRFKSDCLRLVDEVNRSGKTVVVTRHGKAVAKLVPITDPEEPLSPVGILKGTVLRYDDPFAPAAASEEWDAER